MRPNSWSVYVAYSNCFNMTTTNKNAVFVMSTAFPSQLKLDIYLHTLGLSLRNYFLAQKCNITMLMTNNTLQQTNPAINEPVKPNTV